MLQHYKANTWYQIDIFINWGDGEFQKSRKAVYGGKNKVENSANKKIEEK